MKALVLAGMAVALVGCQVLDDAGFRVRGAIRTDRGAIIVDDKGGVTIEVDATSGK